MSGGLLTNGADGWRRAVAAFGLGAVLGGLLALVLPRDEGPRRRVELESTR